MSDVPGADADLAAIHAAFALPVTYTGAGLVGATVLAVRSDTSGDTFQGPGDTLRTTSFEIPFSAFSSGQMPDKGDELVEGDGREWEVIDVTRRDDVSAWVVIVEDPE